MLTLSPQREPPSDKESPLFDDYMLSKALFDAIEVGNKHQSVKTFESLSFESKAECIEPSRTWNVCTLNDFRKRLGLDGALNLE
jgi:hypothetical protein